LKNIFYEPGNSTCMMLLLRRTLVLLNREWSMMNSE